MSSNSQMNVGIKRYNIKTEKKNNIIVEEINNTELETVWKNLSDIQLLF